MYPNLRAEMARFNIKTKNIAESLNITAEAVNNKLSGRSPLTLAEAFRIRDKFFPKMSIEVLFAEKAIVQIAC